MTAARHHRRNANNDANNGNDPRETATPPPPSSPQSYRSSHPSYYCNYYRNARFLSTCFASWTVFFLVSLGTTDQRLRMYYANYGTAARHDDDDGATAAAANDLSPNGKKNHHDHRTTNSSHSGSNYHRRRYFDAAATGTGSATTGSPGRKIVGASFRDSGFADFVNDFCPRNLATTTQQQQQQSPLETGFQADFVNHCLNEAKKAGNTPGTRYHDTWPWWFRTLLRDTVRPRNGLGGKFHYLQFKSVGGKSSSSSSSSHGLQLCVYEKGGTKHWKKLQCDHNHDYYRQDDGANTTNGYNSNNSNNNNTTKTKKPIQKPDFNQCFQLQPPYDGTSEKAVFLRDPLDRFLSGFLDKCVRRLDFVDHCEPIAVFAPQKNNKNNAKKRTKNDNDNEYNRFPIDTMLWDKKRTFQAYVDTFPLSWNMHFFPQSLYCGGLYKTIDDYDFVGSMGEEFYRDLDSMRKRYPGLVPGTEGVFDLSHKLGIVGAGGSSSSSSGKAIETATATATAKTTGSNTRGVETGAAGKVLDYYTPHTVRRVLEYYAMDYVTLGLPIPRWADEMLSRAE